MRTFIRKFIGMVAASVMLLACGGGGADADAAVPEPQPTGATVGMNLPDLSYWDQTYAMADVARQANFVEFDWSKAKDTDANGAPSHDFRLIFNARTIGAGTYKLIFTGRADVSLGGVAGGAVRAQIYDAATNRTTADVVLPQDVTGNTWLTFTNTRRTAGSTQADGVTRVQLWRPGYPTDGSVTFTREFVDAMRTVQVLRTMGMTFTNENPQAHWTERTPPTFIGMTGKRGQSWELLVALANATGRDLWINVPVKADDDYIIRLAQLLRYGSDGVNPYTSEQANPAYPPLRADLNLYIEYGNEIWNSAGGFYGFGWAKSAADMARATPSHPINHGGQITDQWLGLRRYIAWRSAFISQTFRKVWGDSAMMVRVRPVFASQAGNANNYLRDGLMWAEAYFGEASKIWWGGGGATYYGSVIEPFDTQPQTMERYFDGLPEAAYTERIKTDTIWLKAYGLHHVSYEGGPEPGAKAFYTGGGANLQTIANTYNTDPRMPQRMGVAYDVWHANGGELMVYLGYGMSGSPWSFIDGSKSLTVADASSPKMRFLQSVVSRTPVALTLGTAVPAIVHLRDTSAATLRSSGGGSTAWAYGGEAYRLQSLADKDRAEMLLVPIRTQSAGRFSIAVASYDTLPTARLQIYVNGVLAGEVAPGETVNKGVAVNSASVTVNLPQGISVVRLRSSAGDWWVRDIVVRTAG